jgi:hypothetical protein
VPARPIGRLVQQRLYLQVATIGVSRTGGAHAVHEQLTEVPLPVAHFGNLRDPDALPVPLGRLPTSDEASAAEDGLLACRGGDDKAALGAFRMFGRDAHGLMQEVGTPAQANLGRRRLAFQHPLQGTMQRAQGTIRARAVRTVEPPRPRVVSVRRDIQDARLRRRRHYARSHQDHPADETPNAANHQWNFAASQRSASNAAIQPVPAAVTACR